MQGSEECGGAAGAKLYTRLHPENAVQLQEMISTMEKPFFIGSREQKTEMDNLQFSVGKRTFSRCKVLPGQQQRQDFRIAPGTLLYSPHLKKKKNQPSVSRIHVNSAASTFFFFLARRISHVISPPVLKTWIYEMARYIRTSEALPKAENKKNI